MPARIKTNSLYKLYLNVVSSIAFLPTILAALLFLLALLCLSLDQLYPGALLRYDIEFKNLLYPDSARSLLSTIAGGTFSLVVFSFSMVMVVLNQTASNYTPRVLPSLIGRRFHQVIMGMYLGTIAFTFMVLSSIQSKAYAFEVPSLSILINALLSLICLALFVAFIRSISENIQIGNIINRLYHETLETMEKNREEELHVKQSKLPDFDQWVLVKSPISGYFDSINETMLLRTTRNLNTCLRMQVPLGTFVNRGDPFFSTDRQLSNEEQERIFHTIVMRHQEIVVKNYVYGFKQLTEIALKALSPGINDPGTAVQVIDRLTDLLVIKLSLKNEPILVDKDQHLRMVYKEISFQDIFYFCFSSIKNDTATAVPVMYKLLEMLKVLNRQDEDQMAEKELAIALSDAVDQFLHDLDGKGDKNRIGTMGGLVASQMMTTSNEEVKKELMAVKQRCDETSV